VKSSNSNTASDREAIALLAQYKCPTPFHEVRTLLLGNIASPLLNVSPMGALDQIWGGRMPEFDSAEEVKVVATVLIGGLWNRLVEHQSSRNPFQLLRTEVAQTRKGLQDFAITRTQEIEGFVDGLFGTAQEVHLPEKAHHAMGVLTELRSMFAGAAALLADPTKPAPADELKALLRNFQKISLIAETEINKTIQSCKRARRRHLEAMAAEPTSKQTFH
jgi:hypothetical protein